MWICPFCGEENYQNDRVGMDEPKCRACKKERKTAVQVEKEIDSEITDIKIEMKDLRLRMEPHLEMISSLEEVLADEKSDLKELKNEFKDCKHELARLRSITVYTKHDKVLSAMRNPYQKTLLHFKKGFSFI